MAKLTKKIKIDSSDLLKFAAHFDKSKSKSKAAIAKAMNSVGDSVLEEVVNNLVKQTGFDSGTVRGLVRVSPATGKRLNWSLDASKVVPPSGDWSRPWQRRVTPLIDGKQLVRIKTVDDSDVCDFCEEIALGSPYTMEEAQRMQHKYHGLPGFLHPNCRCVMMPWNAFKKIPVKLGDKNSVKSQLLTVRQLGKAVKDELKIIIRV
jgi:hypothetical protein